MALGGLSPGSLSHSQGTSQPNKNEALWLRGLINADTFLWESARAHRLRYISRRMFYRTTDGPTVLDSAELVKMEI